MIFKYVVGVIDAKEFQRFCPEFKKIKLILDDASKKVTLGTNEYSYYLRKLEDNIAMGDLEAYTEKDLIERRYDMNSCDITRLSVDKQIDILRGGIYKEEIKRPCVCYSIVNNSQINYCVRYYAD